MLKVFCAVLAAAPLIIPPVVMADDFLKQLTPKDFFPKPGEKNSLPEMFSIPKLRYRDVLICAIPLKELHVSNNGSMDKIAIPGFSANFDKGIEHAAPIPVCPER